MAKKMDDEISRLVKEELERMTKWHRRFLDLAQLVSTWSKDPSSQVGSIIIDTDTRSVLGLGYNGFPRGVVDRPEWYKDRTFKYPAVVHAEMNAILSSGTQLSGATLYCNIGIPCPDCAGPIIQAGIKKVVFPPVQKTRLVTPLLREITEQMFTDAEVEMVEVAWEP